MSAFFTIEFVNESERFAELPWDSLSPDQYSPSLMAQARHFWSENAFNEWASALAMTQLVQILGEARVPMDLWSAASTFPGDELAHVELCARVARRCGGGVAIRYQPEALRLPLDGSLTPLERATLAVLQVCCLGEAVSQPLLAGNLRAARQPLARAVLERIVRDETRHARFGWQYLEWAAPSLGAAEKLRLGKWLNAQLQALAPLWDQPQKNGDGGGLGWMSPDEWRTLARDTVENALERPLARHGIVRA